MVDVQQRLLRCYIPTFENIECSAMCRQAEAVGGDFYDVFRLPSGDIVLAIGDVSGKGLGAALMMATIQATLRAEARRAPADIAALIARASELFHEASLANCYATLFYAVFDPTTRAMKYVNAGHFPPIVIRGEQSEIEWLDRGGPPVGMLPACSYEAGCIALNPRDVMVAYTDGVIESRNAFGDQWGVERLVRIVMAADDRTPGNLRSAITEAVDAFSCEAAQRDDMALVILRAL
jgi:sigma-B regulation protein RsbU (phosphoserine phosphatase)